MKKGSAIMKRIAVAISILIMVISSTLLGCTMAKSHDYTPKEWVDNNYEILVLTATYKVELCARMEIWDSLRRIGGSPSSDCRTLLNDINILIERINDDKQNNPDTVAIQKIVIAELENQKEIMRENRMLGNDYDFRAKKYVQPRVIFQNEEIIKLYNDNEFRKLAIKAPKDTEKEMKTQEIRKKYRKN